MKIITIAALMVLSFVFITCGSDKNNTAKASVTRGSPAAQKVTFPNGDLELSGLLYLPKGDGPFPAVLYNHGSAAGFLNNQAFDAIAPTFVDRGWAFFAPYRRGQGSSATAGPYIMDEIAAARRRGGLTEAEETMTRILSTDHLSDQLAALAWLRTQTFVRPNAISAMGNSFGGIETILGAARVDYCAAVDAAGAAESWDQAPSLRDELIRAAKAARMPVLFFQAKNDVSLAASETLYDLRVRSGLPSARLIFPAFGQTSRDGHSFAYRGVDIWRDDVLEFLEKACDR